MKPGLPVGNDNDFCLLLDARKEIAQGQCVHVNSSFHMVLAAVQPGIPKVSKAGDRAIGQWMFDQRRIC
jgi:hypothetical protein